MDKKNTSTPFRAGLHEIIFEADTPGGKLFDVLLILSIVASVILVMLDSVSSIRHSYGRLLYLIEWIFTILFTIEYVFRFYSVRRPLAYATSFFGMVDLLAIMPSYLSIIFPGTHYLLVIRVLRVLRIFRENFSCFEAGPVRRRNSGIKPGTSCQSAKNNRVFVYRDYTGDHFWLIDVFNREAGAWVYQHSALYLLGHRYPDHGWLRGYIA
jgi:hypothetical protein